LAALFQAATGAGQDLSGVGFPGASIPPGQQANFRAGATKLFLLWTDAPFHQPGDPGAIPYPGPSAATTVDAILALDPPKVIGISSGGGGIADLQAIALATGGVAPTGGVDCDGDGVVDILEGEALVCSISFSGAGISEAIIALVEAAAATTEVCGNCIDDDGDGLVDLLDPDCLSSPLTVSKGTLRLDRDPDEDKISFNGTFLASAAIDPPTQGATLSLIDEDGLIACYMIPPGEGWKTRRGPKWSFRDKKDDSLGDPVAEEKLSIEFNEQRGLHEVRIRIKDAELADPDAGPISTSVIIGDQGFLNTQGWQSKGRGRKLVTP
jgi:hypothetical protein